MKTTIFLKRIKYKRCRNFQAFEWYQKKYIQFSLDYPFKPGFALLIFHHPRAFCYTPQIDSGLRQYNDMLSGFFLPIGHVKVYLVLPCWFFMPLGVSSYTWLFVVGLWRYDYCTCLVDFSCLSAKWRRVLSISLVEPGSAQLLLNHIHLTI
jgi:hypothetical protein